MAQDVPNRNVAIIKIESDKMSSHVSIKHNVGSVTSDGIKPHHSHLTPDGCSFNKLIILNKPNLSLSNKSMKNKNLKWYCSLKYLRMRNLIMKSWLRS